MVGHSVKRRICATCCLPWSAVNAPFALCHRVESNQVPKKLISMEHSKPYQANTKYQWCFTVQTRKLRSRTLCGGWSHSSKRFPYRYFLIPRQLSSMRCSAYKALRHKYSQSDCPLLNCSSLLVNCHRSPGTACLKRCRISKWRASICSPGILSSPCRSNSWTQRAMHCIRLCNWAVINPPRSYCRNGKQDPN